MNILVTSPKAIDRPQWEELYRGAKVGFLDDLFVKPEARGQGIVEVLYESLNQLTSEQAWPFTRWITAENNYRGRAVYDKLADKTHWVTYQMPTS